MATIGVSDELKDELEAIKDRNGHTSYDSVIRELVLYRRFMRWTDVEPEREMPVEPEPEFDNAE